MASRGAVAKNGHVTTSTYKVVRQVFDAKVLVGAKHAHGLPDYAHTPNSKYIKENSDGSFREMRIYNGEGRVFLEIAYHCEERLTGNRHEPVLHYHTYDENLARSQAELLPDDMHEKYSKYLEAYGL